jgi:hypothetical protein
VDFHVAQLARESGLVEPESLHTIWPNLRLRQTQVREAVSLGELLDQQDIEADWLFIDCFPAAALLENARIAGRNISVVMARCMQADKASMVSGADLDAVDRVLVEAGFRRLSTLPERNPAVCCALYAKEISPTHPKVAPLIAAAAQASKVREEGLRIRIDLVEQQVRSMAQDLESRVEQLAASAKLARELVEQRHALERQHRDLQNEFTQKEQRVLDLQNEVATLQARAEVISTEHTRSLGEATQARDRFSQLATQRQDQIKSLEQQLAQLKKRLATSDRTNLMLRAEVDKAESQIALIRDFLLQEPRR